MAISGSWAVFVRPVTFVRLLMIMKFSLSRSLYLFQQRKGNEERPFVVILPFNIQILFYLMEWRTNIFSFLSALPNLIIDLWISCSWNWCTQQFLGGGGRWLLGNLTCFRWVWGLIFMNLICGESEGKITSHILRLHKIQRFGTNI